MIKIFYFIMCFMFGGFLGAEDLREFAASSSVKREYSRSKNARKHKHAKLARTREGRDKLKRSRLIDLNGNDLIPEVVAFIKEKIDNLRIYRRGLSLARGESDNGWLDHFYLIKLKTEEGVAVVCRIGFPYGKRYKVNLSDHGGFLVVFLERENQYTTKINCDLFSICEASTESVSEYKGITLTKSENGAFVLGIDESCWQKRNSFCDRGAIDEDKRTEGIWSSTDAGIPLGDSVNGRETSVISALDLEMGVPDFMFASSA